MVVTLLRGRRSRGVVRTRARPHHRIPPAHLRPRHCRRAIHPPSRRRLPVAGPGNLVRGDLPVVLSLRPSHPAHIDGPRASPNPDSIDDDLLRGRRRRHGIRRGTSNPALKSAFRPLDAAFAADNTHTSEEGLLIVKR